MKVNNKITFSYNEAVSDWEINSYNPFDDHQEMPQIENCYVAGMVPYDRSTHTGPNKNKPSEYMYLYPDYVNIAQGGIKQDKIKCVDNTGSIPRAQPVFSGIETQALPSPKDTDSINICKRGIIKFADSHQKTGYNVYDQAAFISQPRFYCDEDVKQQTYKCNYKQKVDESKIIVNQPLQYNNISSIQKYDGPEGVTLNVLMNDYKCFSDCTKVSDFERDYNYAYNLISSKTKDTNTRWYCSNPNNPINSRCEQYLVSSRGFIASKDVNNQGDLDNIRPNNEDPDISNIKSCAHPDSFDPRGFKTKAMCEQHAKPGPNSGRALCSDPKYGGSPDNCCLYKVDGDDSPAWNIDSYPISIKGTSVETGSVAEPGKYYNDSGKNQKWGCLTPNEDQNDNKPGKCALYIEGKSTPIDHHPCGKPNSCYTTNPGAPYLSGDNGRREAALHKDKCIENCYNPRGASGKMTCGANSISPDTSNNGDAGYFTDLAGGGESWRTANLYKGMYAGCTATQYSNPSGCTWAGGNKAGTVNCITGKRHEWPSAGVPVGGHVGCIEK